MKWFFSFFLFSGLLLSGCREKEIEDPLDHALSVTSAKEDLLLFRNMLEEMHPSLNLYKSRETLNQFFDSLNATFNNTTSLRNFYNSLQFIATEIGCSHTQVSLPRHVYDTLQNRKIFFPYVVLWLEDKLIVNISGYDLAEGTQIVSINGVPITEILSSLSEYNPIEGHHRATQLTQAAKDFAFQYYLKWGPKEQFIVKFTDTLGRSLTKFINPITFNEWSVRNYDDKYYYDPMDVDYDLSLNDKKGYGYLRLPTFAFESSQRMNAFENFCANSFELLSKKKNITRLIIDIRENGGGKLYGACLLFSYLTKTPFIEFDSVTVTKKRLPYSEFLDSDFAQQEKSEIVEHLQNFRKNKKGYYNYPDSMISKWEPDKNRFSGQVYVITNAATVSAASYFALMVKYSGVGKIIGDETAGGSYSGNGFKTLEYVLPQSGVRLFFPYARMVYNLRDTKNTGRGVIPDYIVPDTYSAFKNNEDVQFKYILDSLNLN